MYITNPARRRKILNDIKQSMTETSPTMYQDKEADTPKNIEQAPQLPVTPSPTPAPSPLPQYDGTGYMIVRVTTASGAIPIEGARVTIREYNGGASDIITVKETNISGLTEKVALPTPARSMSLGAGRGKAYASYYVQVDKEGYNPQYYINVPIFDGITAMQNANIVPLPENGETDRFDPYSGIFVEGENPKLEQAENTPQAPNNTP